ncbi:MtrB/PioB family outer membrane beta-barrel protein [Thauera aromatica]|uniref:Uncharacterized protein n=1 Tax=Thauera aromatica K172 TaxID=44139 RepID=A0A2R4BRM9_THAAR|nr:MtrB/PioB family outer membrane beta-barrel protein [Thauera aromatica]AVR89987.1 hypothetical protein Tharo_3106 [Thauera aromatica K172]MCK2096197.1 MtrB/PioB family outer membrane beta-barrel protein [Thauera aromatica]
MIDANSICAGLDVVDFPFAAAVTLQGNGRESLKTFKLFAEYEMKRDLALRIDAVHDRWRTNDWLWVVFQYADGTTREQDERQNVTFVGVSVRYRWR